MDESLTDSRTLSIPGLRNARAVVPDLFYRSGRLGELTPEGVRELAKLDLRTVIDLREPVELARFPDRDLDGDVELVHLPLLPQDGTDHGATPLAEVYPLMADHSGPAMVAVLRRLLEPQALPALVHCAVGRDRTGIIVAVLLALLGVPDEEIVADFLLSNEALGLLDGPQEYVDAYGVIRLSHPVQAVLITDLLARIRERHGSVAGYLADHGLNPDEAAALRRALLGD